MRDAGNCCLWLVIAINYNSATMFTQCNHYVHFCSAFRSTSAHVDRNGITDIRLLRLTIEIKQHMDATPNVVSGGVAGEPAVKPWSSWRWPTTLRQKQNMEDGLIRGHLVHSQCTSTTFVDSRVAAVIWVSLSTIRRFSSATLTKVHC